MRSYWNRQRLKILWDRHTNLVSAKHQSWNGVNYSYHETISLLALCTVLSLSTLQIFQICNCIWFANNLLKATNYDLHLAYWRNTSNICQVTVTQQQPFNLLTFGYYKDDVFRYHQSLQRFFLHHRPSSSSSDGAVKLIATSTFLQANTQSSTWIPHSYTLQMPQPSESITPHHIHHILHTQETVQIHTALTIIQRHPTHPSHHYLFLPLQTLQICVLHRPGFSLILCQYTLDTSL